MIASKHSIACLFLVTLVGCNTEKPVQTSGPLVVNVLDKELYDDCHITGSIHIPFNQLKKELSQQDKSREIVVYCSNYRCTSSHYAVKQLQDLGFGNAQVYEGGMAEWYQQGYPVTGAHAKGYL